MKYILKIRLEVKQEKNKVYWREKKLVILCTREDEVRSTKEEVIRVENGLFR